MFFAKSLPFFKILLYTQGNDKNMKKVFLTILFFSFILVPLITNAGLVPCGPGVNNKACTLCDLFTMLSNIYNFVVFTLIPPLAALMLVFGGFMFIAQQFVPDGLKIAQSIFKHTITGLIIIYGAHVLISAFFLALGYVNASNWWSIPSCPN